MTKYFISTLLSFCLAIATAWSAENSALKNVYIDLLDPNGEYSVIDSRMDETGTSGVLFGVIGAAVNSGINGSEDEERAEQWAQTASKLNVGDIILESMQNTLLSRDVTFARDKDSADFIVTIDVQAWGITRRNQTDPEKRAFLNVNLTLLDGSNKVLLKEYPSRLGKFETTSYDDFTDQVFTDEITTIAEKLGRSAAYTIIFQ